MCGGGGREAGSVSMTSWKAQAPAALEVPGVSSSIGDSMPLHMTLSPVDPSFLEGASSLARFGLDIGGTLCKVVFFEPDEAHAGGAPLDKSRLSRTSAVGDQEDVSIFSNGGGSEVNEEESSVCKRSRPTPRVFSKSAMSAGQARKMWVSSHDPVHIPGRGTLYFKCFGVYHCLSLLNPPSCNHLAFSLPSTSECCM